MNRLDVYAYLLIWESMMSISRYGCVVCIVLVEIMLVAFN